MPPRAAPGGSGRGGRGGPPRGGPPRGGPPRGGPPRGGARGGPRGGARGGAPVGSSSSGIPEHVRAIGAKRPGHGTSGPALEVYTNHFKTTIPQNTIYQYDVVIDSVTKEKTLPIGLNFDIMRTLQETVAPNVFTPRCVYDGRKILYSSTELSFGHSAEFDVTLPGPSVSDRPPKVRRVAITYAAAINPEVLARFLQGNQSHDTNVITAVTAMNVVVRMDPSLKYPFNVRSFFTPQEQRDIGAGIVLWRGYFQSVRPALGQMLINIDITTGAMYKPGPLMRVCLEVLGRPGGPELLAPRRGLPDRERLRVQRFIQNIRIVTKHGRPGQGQGTPRTVKKLSKVGARELTFSTGDRTMTVAEYFQSTLNRPLQYPDVVCVELASGALIPLELCEVPPGQIVRKQVPPEKTKDVLEFSTKKPQERFNSIRNGLGVLQYGQSDYVRSFGMVVSQDPLSINARVLPAPMLKYGAGSRQPNITPRDGAWNMIDKKMYEPTQLIDEWIVVVYETQRRFGEQQVANMAAGLRSAAEAVGIRMAKPPALTTWESGQGNITEQLRAAGGSCRQRTGKIPSLIVVILPEGGNDIYSAVKFFGDVSMGVVTQCMKSNKCYNAKPQYFANVCLKMNAKFGGKNMIPDPRSVSILTDPARPTVVMGADVIHPAPGSEGRPSYTALVANVDSDSAKYIATMQVQPSRVEIIQDLEAMAEYVLTMYMGYRRNVEKKEPTPKRIIFYRDGVSEGQFQQVIDLELPLIKKACAKLNINPQITVVVVGKRHHVRFFPKDPRQGDRSGNCPAGTVVDSEITSPVEFDFYLQSHGGLLGTSRPAHYNVLHDECGFTADGLQSLSFALCHVYARSTRSVSIPAPVYYADIVCSRAKHHYDPQVDLELTIAETNTNTTDRVKQIEQNLEVFRSNFKPLHPNMRRYMYFC